MISIWWFMTNIWWQYNQSIYDSLEFWWDMMRPKALFPCYQFWWNFTASRNITPRAWLIHCVSDSQVLFSHWSGLNWLFSGSLRCIAGSTMIVKVYIAKKLPPTFKGNIWSLATPAQHPQIHWLPTQKDQRYYKLWACPAVSDAPSGS